ncbi:hypothetical protein [Entomobacter blattae]|uniref:Uncharacterized protein n=1 Tax=Entomobacter blattae TaxID=2762277 RepID=A0A7H1NQ35_9PROT|nr:hypothetical protein [Entomobacter blattae]QNT77895.1 hypothetical protein JGUZn3_06530 [Entomobacter blattae]
MTLLFHPSLVSFAPQHNGFSLSYFLPFIKDPRMAPLIALVAAFADLEGTAFSQ